MSELLFEGYSAPSVSYSIDSLMSLYATSPDPTSADALVISSSTASTHVIPVLGGQAIMTSAKKYVRADRPFRSLAALSRKPSARADRPDGQHRTDPALSAPSTG